MQSPVSYHNVQSSFVGFLLSKDLSDSLKNFMKRPSSQLESLAIRSKRCALKLISSKGKVGRGRLDATSDSR